MEASTAAILDCLQCAIGTSTFLYTLTFSLPWTVWKKVILFQVLDLSLFQKQLLVMVFTILSTQLLAIIDASLHLAGTSSHSVRSSSSNDSTWSPLVCAAASLNCLLYFLAVINTINRARNMILYLPDSPQDKALTTAQTAGGLMGLVMTAVFLVINFVEFPHKSIVRFFIYNSYALLFGVGLSFALQWKMGM